MYRSFSSYTPLAAAVLLSLPAGVQALDIARNELTRECETALALSALPSRLREDATVYGMVDGKYEKLVEGAGAFTCIVERNHEASVAPQCMDREGARTILPALIEKGELAMTGDSADESAAKYKKLVDSGKFESAGRPGVSYMMSDYNYIYVPRSERTLKVPPHIMFYAPNLTNDDIGGSLQSAVENFGTPFLFNQGVHGYMITYAEHASDSTAVVSACKGQLGEPPPRFNPFPQSQ